MRPESNNFLIDGARNINNVDTGFALKPPIDSIAEFRIITSGASAEFGESLGSNTNLVMKSGSNAIHGSVYEFFRNDVFDARNFFSQDVEPLKQNQFGATVGGPLKKDKTFFFGYYEGFRNRQGNTRTTAVPSDLERQGDFSQSVDANGQVPPLINYLFGQPVPGNRIPQSKSIQCRGTFLTSTPGPMWAGTCLPALRFRKTTPTSLEDESIIGFQPATKSLCAISSRRRKCSILFPSMAPTCQVFRLPTIFAVRT